MRKGVALVLLKTLATPSLLFLLKGGGLGGWDFVGKGEPVERGGKKGRNV